MTKTKTNLEQLALEICRINAEVKFQTKLMDEMKAQLLPYLNPGEFIACELGTVKKSKSGQTSFKYLSKQGEAEMVNFKRQLIGRGQAIEVKGDPYLIVESLKPGI